ncbi:MAG: hypothetical protein CHKLHMKO_00005 [Candidatus Argoarchaeum ethanivorans]|uniref:PIN domain-containing protein n=1 Tax=Candidatus Argoarchaeum ethanivorans TaxID=2608793 RepID=A0A811T583_9EURY|nr:MAG: hypothetical protein CHKLHMKO_00005 [Candidatus Argoarchaeum ethanivorans]
MAKIAIDANIPISFNNEKVDFWSDFIKYVKVTGHEILIPIEVFRELLDRRTRRSVEDSNLIQKIAIGKEVYDKVKNDCRVACSRVIQNNDYKLIAMAVHEDVDYLVSNDYALINVVKAYKKSKGISKNEMFPMTAANLLWLMHSERKDLFGWKQNVRVNLKFYRHIEIPNTYDGITKRQWDEQFAKNRFDPYQMNIINTIDSVGR